MENKDLALSKFAKFEYKEMNRSDIEFAFYNPRNISAKAEKHLKENISNVGLLTTIVVNKRTNRVVSGHQRLKILDRLERTKNYKVPVALVDLDETQEKEQNIFMNNQMAQGMFDFEKINEMVRTEGVRPEKIGMDTADIFQTFGYNPVDATAEMADKMADSLREMRELEKLTKEKLEKKTVGDFYCVFFFESKEDRDETLQRMGLEDNKYQSGLYIKELLNK